MTESGHKLLWRLSRLRNQVRLILVVYGLLLVAAIWMAGTLLLFTLDWLLWLPGQIRLLLSITSVILAAWSVRRWILRPAMVAISVEDVAGRLDRRFLNLNDRLVSAVDFLRRVEAGPLEASRDMMFRVVEETRRLTDSLPFTQALTLRPTAKVFAGSLLVCATWVVMGVVRPEWSAIGFQRFVHPLGPAQWPKRVQIRPISGDETVALGESLSLAMEVSRGDSPGLRPAVHLLTPGNRTRSYIMEAEAGGTYRWVASGVTEDFRYWFQAGDDETPPFAVRVVRRPAVASMAARIEPPAYASDWPPAEVTFAERELAAVKGSRITMHLTISKPVRRDEQGRPDAWLLFESAGSVQSARSGDSDTDLKVAFPLESDDVFRVRVTDTDGFTNADSFQYRLSTRPDRIPVVTVIEPAGQVEVTPEAVVRTLIEATDDLGLTAAALKGAIRDRTDGLSLDLSGRLSSERKAQSVQATVAYDWELRPLALKPGDVVVYHFEAKDNFPLQTKEHSAGRTSDLRLKVVSPQQFTSRLRDEFQLLRGRLRELLAEQETIHDETASSVEQQNDPKPLTEGQREAVARLAGLQNRLAVRTSQLGGMFEQIRQRLERNRVEDADSRRETVQTAEALDQVSRGAMTEAAGQLHQASVATDRQSIQSPLEGAQKHQTAAADAIRQLLLRMDRWGDFSDIVQKTRDLFDRQEELTKSTAKAGQESLGKQADELTPEQRRNLAETARQQQRLGEETETLTGRMKELSESGRERDPAGSEALREAQGAAGQWEVADKMKRAAARVRDNQAAQARQDQQDAERGLREMLVRLEQRQSRELSELAKRLEKAEDSIRLLIEQQTRLLADNVGAQAEHKQSDVFKAFVDAQTLLKRNTQQLAQEIGQAEATTPVSRHVQKAATQMSQAAISLADGDGKGAQPHQQESIEDLKRALARLVEIRNKTEKEIAERRLAAIRDQLIEVRQSQQEVREASHQIVDRLKKEGTLLRADTQRLNRLGEKEAAIGRTIDGIRGRMASADACKWVMQRVAADVDAILKGLAGRSLSPELVQLQDSVISRLDQLIEALRIDPKDVPDDRFAGDATGGDQGRPQREVIPPVAELRILKAMQLEVNRRTIERSQGFDGEKASEQTLSELRQLGEDQGQIRNLCEAVVRRATEGTP